MANKKEQNLAENLKPETAITPTVQTSDDVAAAEKAASEEPNADKAAADVAAAEVAAADKAAAAKAAAAKAKQDAAAAKAAKSESDAALKAIEDNTASVVNADPYVTILITPKNSEDKRAEVCINGHWWKMKKGERVSVPMSVVLILRESEKVLMENESLMGDIEVLGLGLM